MKNIISVTLVLLCFITVYSQDNEIVKYTYSEMATNVVRLTDSRFSAEREMLLSNSRISHEITMHAMLPNQPDILHFKHQIRRSGYIIVIIANPEKLLNNRLSSGELSCSDLIGARFNNIHVPGWDNSILVEVDADKYKQNEIAERLVRGEASKMKNTY